MTFNFFNTILILMSVLVQLAFSCTDSPKYWCSSRQIARDCQVELQCEKYVWKNQAPSYESKKTSLTLTDNDEDDEEEDQHYFDDEKVELGFYYETLCPDCQVLFGSQLVKTYKSLSSILELDLVPYGNAEEIWNSDKWDFLCQHGVEECHRNIIQTCALDIYPFNTTFSFIACMETTSTSLKLCAKKYGLDIDALEKCGSSSHGNQLEHRMADKTNNLNPPHEYVPWITVNGEHTDLIQQQAENDMIALICSTYKGSKKPPACDGKKRNCKKN